MKHTGDFWKYYSGKNNAKILTVVIGGNHEASHHMRELYYGGWLAPNIFYLGAASLVNLKLSSKEELLGNLKLFGISGIFKQYSFYNDHPFLPFDNDTKRNCYHVRQLELLRGLLIKDKVDICLSHDWPRGAHKFGDYEGLIKIKPFFEKDVNILFIHQILILLV